MATLTWRDVAAPSFGGVNEAYRTSAAQLSQALSGLSDGIKQFQAQRQAGIDAGILGRAMQIQDPAQMREALASGSLLQGVDLSKINPKILAQLDERTGALLRNAATEQNIASSKLGDKRTQQTIDQSDYTHNRTVQENTNEDAARGQLAQQLGLTGSLANLSTKDQQNVASTQSTLATQRLGRAATSLNMDQTRQNMNQSATNFSNAQEDRSLGKEAAAIYNNVLTTAGSLDGARIQLDAMTNVDPRVKNQVVAKLASDFPGLYTATDAPVTGKGGAAAPANGTVQPSQQAAQLVNQLDRRIAQNSSAGVVADIQANRNDTRSAPEVAQELGKLFEGTNQQDLAKIIQRAQSDNPNLSAADIGTAIKRSISGNWLGSTRFADGIGVDDSTFRANLETYNNGLAELASEGNRQAQAVRTQLVNADAALTKATQELMALQRRKETTKGVDTTAAEKRVSKAEDKLNTVILNISTNSNLQPEYTKPVPKMSNRPVRNRAER